MDNPKVIRDVVLREIRGDGAQHYEWERNHRTLGTSLWITGYNRTSNVRVGDMGLLVYESSPGHGLWFFRPYNQQGMKTNP